MKQSGLFAKIMQCVALALFIAGGVQAAVEEYEIDAIHSSAEFKVKHLAIANVRGGFTDISGTLMLDRENPDKSSIEVTIGVNSVDTRNKKRDEHLRTADFFEVEKYPTMKFKSNKVKVTGEGEAEITGDFTLHGMTKSITVKAGLTGEGDGMKGEHRIGFETEFKIKKSEYGMKHHVAVGDEVKIWFEAELVRKEPGGK